MKSRNILQFFLVVFLCFSCSSQAEENEPIDCEFENPLTDLPWLKVIVDGFENDAIVSGYNPHACIYQCAYKDGIGFLLEMCVGCPDAGYSFRNCEGDVLCGGGGHSGEDNCLEFNIDIKNKRLIWEMEKNQIKPQEPCHCIMDTLKGEWSWIKTYTAKHGIIDNKFKSIFKVFSQNEDLSINYEVIVEDTLYSKGNFQLQYSQWFNEITNIKLPHWLSSSLLDEKWFIYFGDILIRIENTLCFWEGDNDGYMYFYQKIK